MLIRSKVFLSLCISGGAIGLALISASLVLVILGASFTAAVPPIAPWMILCLIAEGVFGLAFIVSEIADE